MKSIEGQCRLSRKRFADDQENGVINGIEGGTEIKGTEGLIYQGQLHDIYYQE